MHVTDLAINRALGMQTAPPGTGHIMELPESPILLNHIGTVHASAQFALAEAASGEFLLRHFHGEQTKPFAVLRTSAVKFRKPASGTLNASARFADGSAGSIAEELAARGRAMVSVSVEVGDAQGVVTMAGQFDWFLAANP